MPCELAEPFSDYHGWLSAAWLQEAILYAGMKDEALETIDEYWGGMVRLGADTFWEIYRPENPNESPYGGNMSRSYCHAWSCTPAYILRLICG